MAWITITLNDVATVVTPEELRAHRRLAAQSDNSDAVQPVIDEVTTEVRGYVQACPRNIVGEAGTIPSELRQAALALIAARIPVGGKIDGDKKARMDDAIKLLDKVANCKFALVPPENAAPTTEQAAQGGRITISNKGPSRLGNDSLRGL